MRDGAGLTTALILLPVEYNPDERGERMPIEDEKFTRTADELSCELEEGGTIHLSGTEMSEESGGTERSWIEKRTL
jgi:hypothetical protein